MSRFMSRMGVECRRDWVDTGPRLARQPVRPPITLKLPRHDLDQIADVTERWAEAQARRLGVMSGAKAIWRAIRRGWTREGIEGLHPCDVMRLQSSP